MGKRCAICGFPLEDHPTPDYCSIHGDTSSWRQRSLQKQLNEMGLHLQASKIKVVEKPAIHWTSYYLACPYTDANSARSWARVTIASQVAARLMSKDSVVFSPITHGHHIAEHLPPDLLHDHEFWMHQCLPMVEWAATFALIPLQGWRTSRGVLRELELAKELGKPIVIIQLPGYPTCELFPPEQVKDHFGPSSIMEII